MTVLVRTLCLAALLIAATAACWSYPTLYGDTGLVLVPTADVLTDTFIDIGFNYTRLSEDAGKPTLYPIRLTYGASENTEMFVTVGESSTPDDEGGFDVIGGGFKVLLKKEDLLKDAPGIAFGARLIQVSGATDSTQLEGYGVVSKTIYKKADIIDEVGYTVRLHLAGFFTRYGGDVPDEDFFSAAGGISYNNFDGTSIAVDYIPELTSGGVTFRDAEISAAVRRPISRHFLIELGTTQPYGVGNGGDLYAGLLYHWGISDAPTRRGPRVDTGY